MNGERRTVNGELEDKVRELVALNDDLTNLLAATDIATLFIDAEFRVRRFTAAAAGLLNLIPGDIGRPLRHLASTLVDFDLATEAERVLNSRIPSERAVRSKSGGHYLARVGPCGRDNQDARGLVVTIVDVTALKNTEHELRSSRRRAEVLARLNQEALATTSMDGLTEQLVRAVAETLDITFVAALERDESGERFHWRAGTGWDETRCQVPLAASPEGVAMAAGRSCVFSHMQNDRRFAADDRVVQHRLATAIAAIIQREGELWGVLAAFTPTERVFSTDEVHFVDAAANALGTALSRAHADAVVRALNETLEQRVRDRTRHLAVMHDITRAVTHAPSRDVALRSVLHRICQAEQWQIGYVHLPDRESPQHLIATIGWYDDPRFQAFDGASCGGRFHLGATLPGRVFREQTAVWLNDQEAVLRSIPERVPVAKEVGLRSVVALPVDVGGEMVAVVELFSDQVHERTDDLTRLMDHVVAQIGRVIERERFVSQMADLVWAEQQNLLHTLHDSVGQQLTGLGMLSSSLSRRLDASVPSEADTARQVAKLAEEALEQVRNLSKGMYPVEVAAEGLALALRQLASRTEAVSPLRCTVEVDPGASVPDNRVATELYRIAQEAVTNAMRHASAQLLSVRLEADAGGTVLRIVDDGVGIHTRAADQHGMGLRIMHYRATAIGANLNIEPAPRNGTIVTCTVRGVSTASRPQPVRRS